MAKSLVHAAWKMAGPHGHRWQSPSLLDGTKFQGRSNMAWSCRERKDEDAHTHNPVVTISGSCCNHELPKAEVAGPDLQRLGCDLEESGLCPRASEELPCQSSNLL